MLLHKEVTIHCIYTIYTIYCTHFMTSHVLNRVTAGDTYIYMHHGDLF